MEFRVLAANALILIMVSDFILCILVVTKAPVVVPAMALALVRFFKLAILNFYFILLVNPTNFFLNFLLFLHYSPPIFHLIFLHLFPYQIHFDSNFPAFMIFRHRFLQITLIFVQELYFRQFSPTKFRQRSSLHES